MVGEAAVERYSAVVAELKSSILTTDWPGNRVGADLSTVATTLEIVGDRACFISDVVDEQRIDGPGVVAERLHDSCPVGRERHVRRTGTALGQSFVSGYLGNGAST